MKVKFNFIYVTFILFLLPLTSNAQSLISLNNKYGISDNDGKIIWEPIYDSVIQYKNSTLFILKIGNKYALTYKVTIDYNKSLEEEEKYWFKSDFVYDTVIFRIAGLHFHDIDYCYISLMFKQNGLYGMIDIEASGDNGGGMFIGRNFYVYGLGKFHSSEAKYEGILSPPRLLDNYYTTKLNGKYGLWDIVTGEEYPVIFDEEPLKLTIDQRFVKLNGKYGAIQIDKNQGYEYLLPCVCSEIKEVHNAANFSLSDPPKTIACRGHKDTLIIYDPKTRKTQTPLMNGSPYIIDTTKRVNFEVSFQGDRSLLYIQEYVKNIYSDSSSLSTYLLIYDLDTQKTIFCGDKKGELYDVIIQSNPIVIISNFDSIEKKYINELRFLSNGNKIVRKSSNFAVYIDHYKCNISDLNTVLEITEYFPNTHRSAHPKRHEMRVIMYSDNANGTFMKRYNRNRKCKQ